MQNVKETVASWHSICKLVAAGMLFTLTHTAQAHGDPTTPVPPNNWHFEVLFMEDMIDHHAMAVEMSDLCLKKAIHPELQQTCREMKTSQQMEISKMKSWVANWYRIPNYRPRMTEAEQDQMKKLQALPGDQFEKQFMMQMVSHHATAIQSGAECLQRAVHKELIDLCSELVTAQAREMKEMRNWLCDWYRLCWLERSMAM